MDELSLYDIVKIPGVAADLAHINTECHVKGYLPPDNGLQNALRNAMLVFVLAGVYQKVKPFVSLADFVARHDT